MKLFSTLTAICFALLCCGAEDLPRLQMQCNSEKGIYRSGEKIELSGELLNRPSNAVFLKCETMIDGVVTKKESLPADQKFVRTFTAEKPGWIALRVTVQDKDKKTLPNPKPVTRGYDKLFISGIGVLIEPEKLRPAMPEPEDFDAFWEKQKALLKTVPIKAVRKEFPKNKYKDRALAWEVEIDAPGGAPVKGYLSIPPNAAKKSLPIVVTPHGAGIFSAENQAWRRNAISFNFNAHGIENGRDEAYYREMGRTKLRDWAYQGQGDPETWYFRNMVLRLLRALEYLKTLPEWNGRDLVMYGNSMGGAQSLWASALDPDVSLCLAAVPGLADLGIRIPGRFSAFPRGIKRGKWCSYYDTAYFAKRIRCRTYLSAGGIDYTCPPDTVYCVFNALPVKEKGITFYPALGHVRACAVPMGRTIDRGLKLGKPITFTQEVPVRKLPAVPLFSPDCLNSFPEEVFRTEVENRLADVEKNIPQHRKLAADLEKEHAFRAFAVNRRLELTESLIKLMRRRLASGDKGMLLLAWSAKEQLRLLDEYFIQEAALFADQKKNLPQKTFNVKTFGAKGDGKTDDGPAIRKAIEAALAEPKPATVFLPAGNYRIEPLDYKLENYRNRQFGTVSKWEIKTLSRAHLLIRNATRLTFSGEKGTRLLFTDPTIAGLRLLGSYNTRVKDLVLDYDPLPFTQGKIIGALPDGMLEIEIDPGFSSPLLPNFLKAPSRRITPIDPKTHQYFPQTFPIGKVRELGDRRFAVEVKEFRKGTSHKNLAPGVLFDITSRYDRAFSSTISSLLSRFDEFENVIIHSSPSFNYRLHCDGAILSRCRVEPAPGRLISGNADGVMNNTHRIGPCIKDCVFDSMEDDGINIAASAWTIEKLSSDGHTVVPSDVMNNAIGVLLIDGDTAQFKAAARIVRKNGKYSFEPALPVAQVKSRESLKQKIPAPNDYTGHYLISKVSRPDRLLDLFKSYGGTVIADTQYKNIRGLGIQLTAPSVLVENCSIDTTTGTGVAMTSLTSWNMYFSAYNVILRNNTIRNTGGPAILLKVIPPYSNGQMNVRSINGIVIENNKLESRIPLILENCFDITLSGNTGSDGKPLKTDPIPDKY